MTIVIFIVAIVIFWARLSSLEKQISDLNKRIGPNQNIQHHNQSAQVSTQDLNTNKESLINAEQTMYPNQFSNSQDISPQQPVYNKQYQEEPSAIIEWFKENWILKIGVLLILIGFGWFVSYAFIHNWIGPVGRIFLGFIVGTAFAVFGTFWISKNKSTGGTFLVFGSAIVLITIFAARSIYEFFNPFVALSLVFMVSAYVTIVSIKNKSKALAIGGIILATTAPFFTDVPDPSLLERLLYLGVVALGSVWVASVTKWREAIAASSFILLVYSLPYFFDFAPLGYFDGSPTTILLVSYLIALLYFIVNIIGIIKQDIQFTISDVYSAIANGLFIMTWTLTAGPENYQSILFALWMIIFAIGSFIVFAKTKQERFFMLYALVAIVFLGTATALELDGPVLTIAFILESTIISIGAYLATMRLQTAYNLTLLMIGPALLSLSSIFSSAWQEGIFHKDFTIIILMAAALMGLGLMYRYIDKVSEKENNGYPRIYIPLLIIGSIYVYILIWKIFHFVLLDYLAVMISLIIYTIIGIGSYTIGRHLNMKAVYYYGGALLMFVVGRLILVDVWEMDLAGRVVTFISIGVLFIMTAFIGKKQKEIK